MNEIATELHYAETAVGRIHYAQAGTGEPLLLLHQTPRSWDEYRDVLPLVGRAYRAVAMDTIGFGNSYKPPDVGSVEMYASGVVALLDALGIDRTAIVGHHTGGVVAVEVAAAYPERVKALVLSGTPCVDPAERAKQIRPTIDEIPFATDGSHLQALWNKRAPYYPPDRPDLLQRFVIDALKVFERVEEGHRAVGAYPIRDKLPLLNLPALVVCGEQDWNALPAQELLARLLPRSTTRLVPNAGVPLVDHRPKEFAAIVLEFLDGLGGAPKAG